MTSKNEICHQEKTTFQLSSCSKWCHGRTPLALSSTDDLIDDLCFSSSV